MTAQVATVDHVKQVCINVRPASDEELPSPYIDEFRGTLADELSKYVGETYPKGTCAVYCISGKDAEGPGADFEFVIVISAAKYSPQNFCNGRWQSIWNVDFKDDPQLVEIKGKILVGSHYFEEGNVHLDAKNEFKDSTIFQDLRRKLPVTRTLFPWHNTLQFSLTRDITRELEIGQ
ncbi:F-actin-capping protein subunit [Musa troglodytarum]|uniref:F-actin-capping protein subunit alpha n=1 Tax=Musa troglodytarum TaxID=320322 RepID=A0A9E7H6X9_9LILI|nr:F-actin-capping protein subunit [Musa troglodytarum]